MLVLIKIINKKIDVIVLPKGFIEDSGEAIVNLFIMGF